MTTQNTPVASIIVPAHNEAKVIGRLLGTLAADIASGRIEVIVACNACTDTTAEIARQHGAKVVEIETPSKIAALNAGDDVATAHPRIYIDADVAISAKSLNDLITALSGDDIQCAAPPFTVDLAGRPLLVRAYYAIWLRDPLLKDGYVGSGIYGLSRSGRARFSRFPNIIADDRFIHALYHRSERAVVDTEPFGIQAPRTIRSLFRRRVRICRGNLEIETRPDLSHLPGGIRRSKSWWHAAVFNPLLIPSTLVFAAVNGLARMIARRQLFRKERMDWARDETIRT
jgi:glycosyltransferase involved in cell wall biosynthesis